MTAGFVGWLACVLVAIPNKKFLDKIPAQDLAKILPKVSRLCRPSSGQDRGQDLTQDMARSQPPGKILASCQDLALLGLLPRSCSSWHESCPRTLCSVLEENLPPSCRRAGANSGGVGHCSPKMVLVQVATVVAIVMVLWYQSSPI